MIDANECLAAAKALLDRLPPTAETTARALAWIDLAREVRLASGRATPDGDAGKGASKPKVAIASTKRTVLAPPTRPPNRGA